MPLHTLVIVIGAWAALLVLLIVHLLRGRNR